MTDNAIRPFDQKIRINGLRLLFLILLPLIVFVEPAIPAKGLVEIMEVVGGLMIIAGVLGRFWSILYIGGLKNAEVVRQGPYSLCRHPLYLFSSIAVLGFGMMLGSVLMALLLGGSAFAVLTATARREEAFLRSEFGPAYAAYAAEVPMILPRLQGFSTPVEVTFRTDTLRRNFFDAMVLLAFLPLAELLEYVKDAHALPAIGIY